MTKGGFVAEYQLSKEGRHALLQEIGGLSCAPEFLERAASIIGLCCRLHDAEKEKKYQVSETTLLADVHRYAAKLSGALRALDDDALGMLRSGYYGTQSRRHIGKEAFTRDYIARVEQLEEMAAWAQVRFAKDVGGQSKGARELLAVELGKLYTETTQKPPGKTERGPFDRILVAVLEEADRYIGSKEFSVGFDKRKELIGAAKTGGVNRGK